MAGKTYPSTINTPDPSELVTRVNNSPYDRDKAVHEASRCIECGMCMDACPINMKVQQCIDAIEHDRLEEAVRWIYQTNPFSRVCGRICNNRCEATCAIAMNSKPIAIRALVRYAVDQLDYDTVKSIAAENRAPFSTGKRIAIIGSGPAGLTAAYDLVKKGHGVVVYEADREPGGMMMDGVRQNRVPRDRLDHDIDTVISLGVDLRLNMKVGQTMTMEKLRGNFDAVLVAGGLFRRHVQTGAGASQSRRVSAINLLCELANGNMPDVPGKVYIIGTDNVAMYLAEKIARCQREKLGSIDTTVLRLPEKDVLDADQCWVEKASAAGASFLAVDSINRLPLHEADLVVEAVGQKTDISYLGQTIADSLERQFRDPSFKSAQHLTRPWLWTVGDMIVVPDIVQSIQSGHVAAEDMHRSLMGQPPRPNA